MIYIENKKRKLENIQKQYSGAEILDVTSASTIKCTQMLSPFYPHGNIPVPFSYGIYASCVEAVWQGLKVFQNADIDIELFKNDTMKGLKRTVRRFGQPLGHRKGVYGTELLNYFEARMFIYLPTYKWVLENISAVNDIVFWISEFSKTHIVVLLDYNTNIDIYDLTQPISHAGLVKLYIEGNYPSESMYFEHFSLEEQKIQIDTFKQNKKEQKRNIKKSEQLKLF